MDAAYASSLWANGKDPTGMGDKGLLVKLVCLNDANFLTLCFVTLVVLQTLGLLPIVNKVLFKLGLRLQCARTCYTKSRKPPKR